MKKRKELVNGLGVNRRRFLQYSLAAGAIWSGGLGFQSIGEAQEKYPNKAITIILPVPPGGTADIQTRGIQPYLQNILGVPLAVESVPGASGIIAYTRTFLSKPDGYTLMFFDSIIRACINERLQKVEYKTLEFTPIFAVSDQPLAWVVNPQVYQSLPQFLEAAKGKPMNVGTSGQGSTSHLYALLVTESLKFKARYVPFGGGAESLNSLLGKHLDAVSVSVGSSYGLVSSGTLKILFISAEKRSTVYPEFPTSKELGYAIPHIPFVNGFAGPPGLPKNIVKFLEEAFSKVMENPEYRAWAKKTKVDVTPLNAEEYKKVIEQGYNLLEKYPNLLKEM